MSYELAQFRIYIELVALLAELWLVPWVGDCLPECGEPGVSYVL